MRIWWQDIFTEEVPFTDRSPVLWEGMRQALFKVRPEGMELNCGRLEKSSPLNWYPYLEMLNDVYIVKGVMEAAARGYEAAVIGCSCDPGVIEARGMVDIPVIGLLESSLALGGMLGQKAAVVTVWDGYVPIMERRIKLYGYGDKVLAHRPVRSFPLDWAELIEAFSGRPEALIKRFEEVARDCIADGADVIVVGCAYAGPAFTLAGYNRVSGTEVPVVDCAAAGLQMAAALVTLEKTCGLKKSRHPFSLYARAPRRRTETILQEFGLAGTE